MEKCVEIIMTFYSNYKLIKLVSTEVIFSKKYYIAPLIFGYIKKLKGDSEFPRFVIPSHLITRLGFILQHEEYNSKEFEFRFQVLKEEKISTIKEEIKL